MSGLLLLAFIALVWQTGLGIESPYIPLVTIPAVFGPFVARSGDTVKVLVVVVGLALGAITVWAPECRGSYCEKTERIAATAAPGHAQSGTAESTTFEVPKPHRVVYAAVSWLLIVLAGIISSGRLARERELLEENEELRSVVKQSVA